MEIRSFSGPYHTIGLVGRAGAGKDTCADILAAHHGYARLAFADALKIELTHAFGVDPRLFSARHIKETPTASLAIGRSTDSRFISYMVNTGHCPITPQSPRTLMRLWGTEYRRTLDSHDYWLLRAHETVEELFRRGHRRLVITDIRFTNEAAFARDLGATIWRISRDLANRTPATHLSETELDLIAVDRTLTNDGHLNQLVRTVLNACPFEQASAKVTPNRQGIEQ